MAEETADALVEFGTDNVFEFASLAVRFLVVNAEGVLEKTFGEAVAADDIARAAFAAVGEKDFVIFLHRDQTKIGHAGQRANGIDAARGADVFDVGAIPFFATNPDLLEKVVKMDAIVHGDALIGSEMAVHKLDAAVGLLGDVRVVGDHENRVAGTVEFAEEADDDFLVGFIEVARGLVGKNEFRLIDEGASNGDALLFAARQL